MKFCGYNFIEVGEFVISDNPLKVTFNGNKEAKVSVELKLYNDKYKKVGESVYIVAVDDVVNYVGEYSTTLNNRWFRKENYIWHGQDIEILKELEKRKRVLFYLIDNPYVIKDERELNINKSIEHDILQRQPPKWNKRNRSIDRSGFMKLSEID